jgi:hypothetical protein
MKTEKPVHLLLRFSDSLLKDGDTVTEHNKVIESEGAVWFGKMGSPVSQNHIDRLNKQVQEGIPTFVYLVKGNRRKSTAFRGSLLLASKTLPEVDENLVPPYYADLDIPKYVRFWVKIKDIIPIDYAELNKMQVASSLSPIGESLVKSFSGHFIIREDKLMS